MESMNNPVLQGLDRLINNLVAHKKLVITALLATSLGAASFFGYRMYDQRVQVAAHRDFVEALNVYQAPVKGQAAQKNVTSDLQFDSEQEKWEKTEQAFRQGYANNSRAGIAAAFLALQSAALSNLGRKDEALTVLREALAHMKNAELKSYYDVKLALMQLDSEKEEERNAGLERLKAMSFEQQNVAHDQALYHLGEYFWVNKKFDEAKNYWQQFVVKYGSEIELAQQVALVKAKLDLIAV
ncbi:hypothetical protein K2W90_03465 [Candidatus Babeliales bacterium]|nr:hypothetical protein [Candidatus Babeliales bacterium]